MNEHKVPQKVVGKEGVAVVGDRAVEPGQEFPLATEAIGEGTTLDVVVVSGEDPSAFAATCDQLEQVTGMGKLSCRLVLVTRPGLRGLAEDCGNSLSELFTRGVAHVEAHEGDGPLQMAAAGQQAAAQLGDVGRWTLFLEAGVLVCWEAVRGMVVTGETERAAMVCPWTSKSFRPLPGTSWRETARRLAERPPGLASQMVLPVESCFMVRTDHLAGAGWPKEQLGHYGFGGGHVADLGMRLAVNGHAVVRAPNAFVMDNTPGRSDQGGWAEAPAGFRRFADKWGDKFRQLVEAVRSEEDNAIAQASADAQAAKPGPHIPKVCFVFHETTLCGAVLAVTHICNELIARGWDATFASVRLGETHRKRLPMNFEPLIYPDERQMVYRLGEDLPDGSHLMATIWASALYVRAACGRNPGKFLPGYFVQDDERRFRKPPPSEVPYVEAWKVEEAWGLFDRVVVNSDWVLREVAEIRGPGARDLKKIGIGVDPLMFRPRERDPSRVRIMAHSRPSTPRRGWPFIAKVLNAVGAVCDVEIVTYDEDPEGLTVPHTHLGRVSPADLAIEMGRAHVFIEGSERQGWGMQALEAMACGCALVVTANHGIDNFGTNGHDCVVVPHGDVGRTAAVVKHLVERRDERQVLARNARATADRFDWRAIAAEWARWLFDC